MKVDFHVIASGGHNYDSMKSAWIQNWDSERRKTLFPDSELRFLYGTYSPPGGTSISPSVRWDGDVFVGCEESIIPGIMVKTLEMFRQDAKKHIGDRWVIRTNLSSFYLWEELRNYLNDLEEQGIDASGYSGTEDHFSGCGFILGPKAAKAVRDAGAKGGIDFSVEDDVAMSRVIFADESLKRTWAPRVDLLDNGVNLQRCGEERAKAFHFRVKSEDRGRDSAILRTFAENPSRAKDAALRGEFKL
jgi:hypothetical protein